MNPEVRGDYIEDSIESILESNSAIFASFSAVIASNLYNERVLIKLSEILWNLNIPLIVCYSIGFIGYIQLQIKEHFIIESHPDYVLEDLRLDDPFPGNDYAFKYNYTHLINSSFKNTIFVLIL